MRLIHVIATRPNFVKMAPLIAALRRLDPDGEHTLIHTGQHYDRNMSEIFLEELGVPAPDHMLGVGGGSNADQLGGVISGISPLIEQAAPDAVIVPGDVNSTVGAAIACAHLKVPLVHLEAGLRSFDRTMPEEVNRVLTDAVSDLLLTHSPEALPNLEREGVEASRVKLVGNTMIDSLVAVRDRIDARGTAEGHGIEPGSYLLVTLHRPALVDGELLGAALVQICGLAESMPVVFPVHPRTRKSIPDSFDPPPGLHLIDPVGYLDFLSLQSTARVVLTDSGGIQEETTFLGVRCFTLRDNTERPVTVEQGTNTLLGLDPARIGEIADLIAEPHPAGGVPDLWDGRAAERAADEIVTFVHD